MIEIVTKQNRSLYETSLDAMYRMRYRVAVEQWGWSIPGIEEGIDKDDYDTEETIYFLAYDGSGDDIVACSRLNPTTGPHMMEGVFADMCELQGIPVASDIYEYSRYILDHENLTRDEQIRVRGRMSATVNKFCLAAGIHALTWFAYKQMYTRVLPVWETTPLGLPRYFEEDDATYIAAMSKMNETGLQNLRRGFHLRDDEPYLLFRHSWEDVAQPAYFTPAHPAEVHTR